MSSNTADLQRVHSAVLANFTWRPDTEIWGAPEYWDRPALINGHMYGDCDDFALECYFRLQELGYEPHIGVCHTQGGEGYNHAVCICGEYYLDNRERRIVKLVDTFYINWARDNGDLDKPWITFKITN